MDYINGSDLLLGVAGKCIGHCTSHTTTNTSETKDRAVKPVKTAGMANSLYKTKGVVGLSMSVKAEGLCFYDETEGGYGYLLDLWSKGAAVELKCFHRTNDATPYLVGNFVISSLEKTAPAQDDVSYSVQFELAGVPTIDETGFAAPAA